VETGDSQPEVGGNDQPYRLEETGSWKLEKLSLSSLPLSRLPSPFFFTSHHAQGNCSMMFLKK